MRERGGRLPHWLSRVLVLAIVVNLTVGIAVSVVSLYSGVDKANSQVVAMANLSAQLERESAIEWQLASGTHTSSTETAQLSNLWRATEESFFRLNAQMGTSGGWSPKLKGDLIVFQASARRVLLSIHSGNYGLARAELSSVEVLSLGVLRRELAAAELIQQSASHRTSLVADAETIAMMLSASVLAWLLFRSFSSAKLRGVVAAAEARSKAQARFRSLIEKSTDVLFVLDRDLAVLYLTPSFERTLGWETTRIAGKSVLDLVVAEDRTALLASIDRAGSAPGPEVTARWVHASGEQRYMSSVATDLMDDPNVSAIVLNARDVTERRQLEEQLTHSAFHDLLTGLPNRALFEEQATQAIRRATDAVGVAILFVDLDDFKAVNDTLGHAAGDELLIEVAGRIAGLADARATVARLAGDEFALLLDGEADPEQISALGESIVRSLAVPYHLSVGSWTLAASVGAAFTSGPNPATVDSMLRDADIAMYVAKQQGKARFALFDPKMHEKFVERIKLKADLQTAVSNGEIFVVYQPVVDLTGGEMVGVEALVRWMHPEKGLLPPVLFIPIAEETGAIVEIGRFVLKTACEQVSVWNRSLPKKSLTLNVNSSLRELDEPDMVDYVARTLESSGLDPELLTLELTESLLMSNPEDFVPILESLHGIGVRIAIDDFGTGYSSLSYLENLPIDSLKIDKSFTDHLVEGEIPVTLRTIVQLGNALNLKIVAEGIEQPLQASSLREIGCWFGQGYHFDRPLSANDLQARLDQRKLQADVDTSGDRRFGTRASKSVDGTDYLREVENR